MNISPNNEKTEKYLDEISEEYKELLLKVSIDRSTSIDDISMSELLRIDNDIKRHLLIYEYKRKERNILKAFSMIYLILGIIIQIIYTVINTDTLFNQDGVILLISIVITTIGLIASVCSSIITKREISNNFKPDARNQNKNIKTLYFEVVLKWRELEGIVADLSEINPNPKSRSIIEYLLYNNLIKEEEANVLKNFLKIRNSIVHASEVTVSYDDIKKILDEVNTITEKLNNII